MYSLYFPISPFSAACYHICTAKVRIVHSSSSVHLALTLACTRARHTWEARTQARSDVTSQSNGHELTVSWASLPLPSFRRVTRCGPGSVLAGNTHTWSARNKNSPAMGKWIKATFHQFYKHLWVLYNRKYVKHGRLLSFYQAKKLYFWCFVQLRVITSVDPEQGSPRPGGLCVQDWFFVLVSDDCVSETRQPRQQTGSQ